MVGGVEGAGGLGSTSGLCGLDVQCDECMAVDVLMFDLSCRSVVWRKVIKGVGEARTANRRQPASGGTRSDNNTENDKYATRDRTDGSQPDRERSIQEEEEGA